MLQACQAVRALLFSSLLLHGSICCLSRQEYPQQHQRRGTFGLTRDTDVDLSLLPVLSSKQEDGGGGFDCIQHLDSYLPLYESLDPEYQPAAFRFYDSDYAFARERITSSPLFINLVNQVDEIPFTQDDVVGYDEITGGVGLVDLMAQKRVSRILVASLLTLSCFLPPSCIMTPFPLPFLLLLI